MIFHLRSLKVRISSIIVNTGQGTMSLVGAGRSPRTVVVRHPAQPQPNPAKQTAGLRFIAARQFRCKAKTEAQRSKPERLAPYRRKAVTHRRAKTAFKKSKSSDLRHCHKAVVRQNRNGPIKFTALKQSKRNLYVCTGEGTMSLAGAGDAREIIAVRHPAQPQPNLAKQTAGLRVIVARQFRRKAKTEFQRSKSPDLRHRRTSIIRRQAQAQKALF